MTKTVRNEKRQGRYTKATWSCERNATDGCDEKDHNIFMGKRESMGGGMDQNFLEKVQDLLPHVLYEELVEHRKWVPIRRSTKERENGK